MVGNVVINEFTIKDSIGTIAGKQWIPPTALHKVPVILLHDSLGSVDLWRDFPALLARELSRTVIAYDRLGSGKSAARQEPPSIKFITEEATTFFPIIKKHLSLTKYILLGHSVGGSISINVAARDSNCSAVITLSSQAFVENQTIQGIIEAKKMFKQPKQYERLKKWHDDKASWVLRAWTDIWLSPEFATWSLDDCIRQVRCPVLVIHGDNDQYGSLAFPEFIASKVGGFSEKLILKGCGHMPHLKSTDETVTAIKNFMKKYNL